MTTQAEAAPRVRRIPRCDACRYNMRPCSDCRNAWRRDQHAAERLAEDPTWTKGRKRTHPRCEKCENAPGPCWGCQKAKMDADPEHAARRKQQAQAAHQRRKAKQRAVATLDVQEARRSDATVPRCEACPPKGLPCGKCRAARARALAEGAPKAKPATRKPRTPEQQYGLTVRVKPREEAPAAPESAAPLPPIVVRTKCEVCLAVIREGRFCRRHADTPPPPEDLSSKSKPYTSP